jgi:hypothetical protein
MHFNLREMSFYAIFESMLMLEDRSIFYLTYTTFDTFYSSWILSVG